MYSYPVKDLNELLRYIAMGIAPGKTLRFTYHDEPIVISLDRDEIYHVKFACSRRSYCDYEKLKNSLKDILDTVARCAA